MNFKLEYDKYLYNYKKLNCNYIKLCIIIVKCLLAYFCRG